MMAVSPRTAFGPLPSPPPSMKMLPAVWINPPPAPNPMVPLLTNTFPLFWKGTPEITRSPVPETFQSPSFWTLAPAPEPMMTLLDAPPKKLYVAWFTRPPLSTVKNVFPVLGR